MILMKSKHNGYCETCGGAIAVNSVILWDQADGAHHPTCWESKNTNGTAVPNRERENDGER